MSEALPNPGLFVDDDLKAEFTNAIKQLIADLGQSVTLYFKPVTMECPNCSKDFVIRTENGLKLIKDIEIGDKVYDHNGDIRYVKRLFKREYEGEFAEINACGVRKLRCTKNHPFVVINNEGFVKIEAEKLKRGDKLICPIHMFPEKSPKCWSVDWDKYCVKRFTKQFVGAVKDYRNSGHNFREVGERHNNYSNICDFDNNLKIDDDLLYLIGWFCAEGCVNAGKNKREVCYCLNKSEAHVAQKLIRIFKEKFGIEHHWLEPRPDSENLVLHFFNSELARWLNDVCGHLSYNKKIPDFLYKNLCLDDLLKLVDYFIEGDGSKKINENNEYWSTGITSKILAYQIFTIWQSNCNLPSINFRPEYIDTDGQKHADSWTVSRTIPTKNYTRLFKRRIEDNYEIRPVKSVKLYSDKQTVYNFEVEGTHSYIADGVAVGNCHAGPDGRSNGIYDADNINPPGRLNRPFPNGGRCLVCKGTHQIIDTSVPQSAVYTALVGTDPKDNDITEVGNRPENIVRTKMVISAMEDIKRTIKAEIEGSMYVRIRDPIKRGLKDREFVQVWWKKIDG